MLVYAATLYNLIVQHQSMQSSKCDGDCKGWNNAFCRRCHSLLEHMQSIHCSTDLQPPIRHNPFNAIDVWGLHMSAAE